MTALTFSHLTSPLGILHWPPHERMVWILKIQSVNTEIQNKKIKNLAVTHFSSQLSYWDCFRMRYRDMAVSILFSDVVLYHKSAVIVFTEKCICCE